MTTHDYFQCFVLVYNKQFSGATVTGSGGGRNSSLMLNMLLSTFFLKSP